MCVDRVCLLCGAFLCLLSQTCKTSADLRNSAVFEMLKVIFEIRPDPRRNIFCMQGGGTPKT